MKIKDLFLTQEEFEVKEISEGILKHSLFPKIYQNITKVKTTFRITRKTNL